jgi:hypothetical protein
MRDPFGIVIVVLTVLLFALAAYLISPMGSGQMYAILAYLFLAPLLGGILYILYGDRLERRV